jgi:uncharacterized OB-fold protein
MQEGTIVSYTVIRVAPAGFEELAPYACLMVESDQGDRKLIRLPKDADLDGLVVGGRISY